MLFLAQMAGELRVQVLQELQKFSEQKHKLFLQAGDQQLEEALSYLFIIAVEKSDTVILTGMILFHREVKFRRGINSAPLFSI